ncbi:DUF2388 domain-containing protein [Pseudomonas sp. SWRI153]|uniref:DUF2388 domain-containing protein n=1 Tax=Pseudomonas khorasanensis TaxID=2745508 RepID=A0A923F2F1_9PSED|nr:DUF2388 domain-containing protein [Pseudomonas khorasanensis]MBV4486005.1 DUF2388 domain-containing protein [Pseudomonas khorasanensis]
MANSFFKKRITYPAVFMLFISTSVTAELCIAKMCLLKGPLSSTGFGLLSTTIGPFWTTSDEIKSLSKHYVQAVRDDATTYIATDGAFDGAMLESAWRAHLHQNTEQKLSKRDFAHMVLATYG